MEKADGNFKIIKDKIIGGYIEIQNNKIDIISLINIKLKK